MNKLPGHIVEISHASPCVALTSTYTHNSPPPSHTHIQDTTVKQNLIHTIDLIGRALHPDHLKSHDFVFRKQCDLITHLLVEHTYVSITSIQYNFLC